MDTRRAATADRFVTKAAVHPPAVDVGLRREMPLNQTSGRLRGAAFRAGPPFRTGELRNISPQSPPPVWHWLCQCASTWTACAMSNFGMVKPVDSLIRRNSASLESRPT
ncbi:MAG: hypothetical protein R3C19_18710, partial [Planctomycetaceae bacterium]